MEEDLSKHSDKLYYAEIDRLMQLKSGKTITHIHVVCQAFGLWRLLEANPPGFSLPKLGVYTRANMFSYLRYAVFSAYIIL